MNAEGVEPACEAPPVPSVGDRRLRPLAVGLCLLFVGSASCDRGAPSVGVCTEGVPACGDLEASGESASGIDPVVADGPRESAESEPAGPGAGPAVAGARTEAPEGSGPGSEPGCGVVPAGMACVPGGWFVRGIDADPHRCDQADQPADGHSSSVPAGRVRVDSFLLDVTEVTNGAYGECVAAGGCTPGGPTYRDFDAPTQPITGLTWFQARDYCAWRSARLPTDAEWELAARGHDGDWYPWGNEPATCEVAIIEDGRGRACGVRKRGAHPEAGRIAEVCSRAPGRFGLCDMAGNAEEWVADWWTEDWATCGEACAGENPRGPCAGADACPGYRYRSVRGGSWYWPAEHAAGWHRRRYPPDNEPAHHFGFRCAADASD